jgi:hypothetical protein
MIHLTKRPLPLGVTIKSEQDCRSGVVFDMLAEDCHNSALARSSNSNIQPKNDNTVGGPIELGAL